MGIQQLTMDYAGQDNINPRRGAMVTTDNLATITAPGYLNNSSQTTGLSFYPTDTMTVDYDGGSGTFTLSFSPTGIITLISTSNSVLLPTKVDHIAVFVDTSGTLSEDVNPAINGGSIQAGLSGTAGSLISYPSTAAKGHLALTAVANTDDTATVISNLAMGQATTVSIPDPAAGTAHFAITPPTVVSGNVPQFNGTTGVLSDSGKSASNIPAGPAVLLTPAGDQTITLHNLNLAQGSLTAGSSGHSGSLASFPASAAKGHLAIVGVANTGDTVTTLSNDAMGQASTINIPDPADAVGQLLIGATATPFVNGNLPVASGTAGLMGDSGIAASDVQLNTNIIAAQTGNIGGAGAGPISVTVAGMTAASVVVATAVSSSNAVSVLSANPGSGAFDVTFSGDPGADAIVSYVAFIAAQ